MKKGETTKKSNEVGSYWYEKYCRKKSTSSLPGNSDWNKKLRKKWTFFV